MTDTIQNNAQLSQSQRILLALKEAKLKIESYERAKSEPIAIIGMGCRFPGGADTPEKYWEFLRNGRSGIREIPKNRWNIEELYDPNPDAPGKIYVRHGGFLNNTDRFDPAFFRISPREAESLDPQQRLALEVSYEALCHAGIDPRQLAGSQTGVFVGVGQSDYSRFQLNCGDLSRINAYDGTGNMFCFVSGRISYTLGLNGPNLTLDTGCSSSLSAIHLACQSLRSRECDMALCGGVHLVFSPEITVFLCRAHVLSPDGLCRTFDKRANGFARGEGCGMIVLKRLSDALAQNDNILALIRGSAINHDGISSGLTVPNELAQEDLIRRALGNAKADASQISYIEAHGTATSLGDPIELSALGSVFGHALSKGTPIYIGSVKTNFGHLEAAAGAAGLIKTVLALQHREIPPHLHFEEPTPFFDWDKYPFKVPTENTPLLPSRGESRMAGVSSFGMSGINAHIVLEESKAGSVQRAKIPMPVYQKERYWVSGVQCDVLSVIKESRLNTFHLTHNTLLGKRLNLPFSQEIRFESCLSPDSPKFMNEHRIFGQVISPAAAHISIVLSAVKTAFGKESCVLEEVLFSRALVLFKSSFRKVQLILTPQNADTFGFRLISCGEHDDERSESSWLLHVSGSVKCDVLSVKKKDIITPNTLTHNTLTHNTFYTNLHQAGYRLGTPFQWGKEFWRSETEALCRIGKPELPDSAEDYQLYPGLLDTCFQTFWAIRPSQSGGNSDLYVPFSISELRFYKRPDPDITLWCHARRVSDKKNAGELCLFDDNGDVFAEISGFEFRAVNPQSLFQSDAGEWKKWLYQRSWIPKQINSPLGSGEGAGLNWLIFADNRGIGKELARQLQLSGHDTTLVFQQNCSDIRELLKQRAWHGIVHLWHLDIDESGSYRALFSSLDLIQALAKSSSTSKSWIVTQGVYSETPSSPLSCFQSPVWGLLRTLALEHPEISCVCADLPVSDQNHVRNLLHEILMPDGEDQITWRGGIRHAARLSEYKLQEPVSAPFRLSLPEHGILENLKLLPMERRKPAADEIEIEVMTAGLNFKDVLTALGMLDNTSAPLGFECAGKVVSVGESVSSFKKGDEVVASPIVGALASFVTVKADSTALKPENLSFEQASAVSLVFLTAYYALHHLAKIRPKDRILIHAAAGGVGLAAIQIAQQAGAEVFATASPGKWEFLKSLGIRHIMNSRDTRFSDQLREQKMDIVLNSLSGDFIPKSIDILNTGGRFVEIGKIGIWNQKKMNDYRPDISYFSFDLGEVSHQNPKLISAMRDEVLKGFESGVFHPIPYRVFSIREAAKAFQYMAQAKHIGKIVLSISPMIRSDCSYLITGGLGALGIRTARWLCDQGAKYLVLTARGLPSEQAAQQIAEIEQSDAKVLIIQADISDKADAEMIFEKIHAEMPEMHGIIHAAGVIDDAVLLGLDEARFKTVMKPKIDGTWNLHLLTQNMSLDFFVCFSSVSSVLGSSGQGNYAAANAFMDALMRYRRASGLPATSIQWGAWSEGGMAAELNEQHQRRFAEQGMGVIVPNQGMAVLGQMLCEDISEVSVIPADWAKYLKHFPNMPLLSEFAVKENLSSSAVFARQLEAMPAEKRSASVSEFVRSQVASVLKLKSADKIKPRERLFDAGMDSLMAVELRNRLSAELEKSLSATLIFDYPTIEALSDYLCREVLMIESGQSEIMQNSENITDVDMDSLLDDIAQKSDSDLLKELRGQAG